MEEKDVTPILKNKNGKVKENNDDGFQKAKGTTFYKPFLKLNVPNEWQSTNRLNVYTAINRVSVEIV